MVNVDIDVDGVERTINALFKGLEEGLEESGQWLLNKGEQKAYDIVDVERDWTGRTKEGFDTVSSDFNRRNHWKGEIVNPVDHAHVVDRGIQPAGKVDATPSVQDLMPWVVANLEPSDYEGGGGSPGLQPGSGGGGGTSKPGAIVDDDRTIQFFEMDELGLNEESFESTFVKAGSLGDGTNVVWKSHKDTISNEDWNVGYVANEVVWSKAQEDLGYNLGPKSRLEKDSDDIDGTLQEFVPGEQLPEKMFHGYGKVSEFDYTREKFLNENREWVAKTNAIDFIVGNDDRHKNNIRINPEGEPRAIDNGGNQFNGDLREQDLNFISDFLKYDTAVNKDELYEENQKMLDKTEQVLENIVNNEEYRQNLIQQAIQVHGEGSQEHERMVKILGEDIGKGHILQENENGVPFYKLAMDFARDKNEAKYRGESWDYFEHNIRIDSDGDGKDDTFVMSEDEANELDGIENELNDLLGEDDDQG